MTRWPPSPEGGHRSLCPCSPSASRQVFGLHLREDGGEWRPGQWSAQPIACDGVRASIDAVAASWTLVGEEDGWHCSWSA